MAGRDAPRHCGLFDPSIGGSLFWRVMSVSRLGRILLPVLCLFSYCVGTARSQTTPSSLLITTDRTEPIVALDPRDPSTIVVGTNTNYDAAVNGVYPVAYFTSHNGGHSFQGGVVPLPAGYVTAADPSVSIARSGTVFYAYLAESPSYCTSAGRSAVVVSTSTDGGRSFHTPVVVDVNTANDKPFLDIESIPGRKAHVFVTWTRFFANKSEVMLTRSTDGGQSFSPAHGLFTSTRDNSGSIPLTAPHGRMYVIWASVADNGLSKTNPARVLIRTSLDDGVHFGPVHGAGPRFTSIPRMAEPESLRNLTLPAAAVSASGTLYVAWSQVKHDYGGGSVSSDIVLTRSTNGGRSWASPQRVNDSRTRDRFMPSLSPYSDGTVGVAYYDRRAGPRDLGLYAARMRWRSRWSVPRNTRINAGPSPVSRILYIPPGSTCLSPGRFFGDYIGTAAGKNGRLYIVWADGRRGVDRQTDIWFAAAGLAAQ